MTQTVVFVANRGYALTSSRTSLIKRFLASGWNVVIATADDAESRELCKLGVKLEPVSFNRGGVAFVRDVTAFSVLRRIYEKWQPALIHHSMLNQLFLEPLWQDAHWGDLCVWSIQLPVLDMPSLQVGLLQNLLVLDMARHCRSLI